VLLKVVNVDGGDTAASEAIYNALRFTSASGVPIVAFVGGWAASSAPWIALGADVVVMDPRATLALHSAEGVHPDPAVREQYRLSANASILRILEERTIAPAAGLRAPSVAGGMPPPSAIRGCTTPQSWPSRRASQT
jgi:ATP-dependent protease ClpP protease subunit